VDFFLAVASGRLGSMVFLLRSPVPRPVEAESFSHLFQIDPLIDLVVILFLFVESISVGAPVSPQFFLLRRFHTQLIALSSVRTFPPPRPCGRTLIVG